MPYGAYQLVNTTIVTASAMVGLAPVALSTIARVWDCEDRTGSTWPEMNGASRSHGQPPQNRQPSLGNIFTATAAGEEKSSRSLGSFLASLLSPRLSRPAGWPEPHLQTLCRQTS